MPDTRTDYPELWVKAKHRSGCDGAMFRQRDVVTVDRLGRIGNGGIVAHDYRCNTHWKGCKARVLVAERTVRTLAAQAAGELL